MSVFVCVFIHEVRFKLGLHVSIVCGVPNRRRKPSLVATESGTTSPESSQFIHMEISLTFSLSLSPLSMCDATAGAWPWGEDSHYLGLEAGKREKGQPRCCVDYRSVV